MKYSLLFFVLIFSISCKEKDLYIMSEIILPEKEKLNSEKINIQTDIYRPSKLFIYKNKLIVFDNRNREIFKTFTIPSLNFIYSYGAIGGGPDEFQNIDKENINVSEFFEILSRNKLSYYDFNDTSVVKLGKQPLIITKVDPINNFRKMDDSIYIQNNEDYSDRYSFEFRKFNLNSKDETAFGKVVNFDRKEKEEVHEVYNRLSKAICYNKKENKLAVFYYHYPVFKILNKNGDILAFSKVNDKDVDVDSRTTLEYNPGHIYFTEPYATNELIYVMWINRNKQDIQLDILNYQPELLIFDWDAHLVARYSFENQIITFAIQEDLNKLYAVSFNEEDINTIYEYTLPTTKDKTHDKYKKIKNQFYTLEVPNNLNFLFENNPDINKVSQHNNYLMNGNLIGQGLNGKDRNLGSIKLLFYWSENDKLRLNEEVENLIKQHKGDDFLTKEENMNGKDIIHVSYSNSLRDHNDDINTLYTNVFFFEENNNIIEMIMYTQTQDIDKYYRDLSHMINSFSIIPSAD